MTANADQIEYWNDIAGTKWVDNQVRLDRAMAALADGLVAGTAAKPGERVLDIGCGCGDLSLRLAETLGPAGHVVGADISAPMLAHAGAREKALPTSGRAPIEWLQADAMLHPFEADRDLLVSRFGVMFFEDQARAFANLRRALRPGGRLAFLTWQPRPAVDWMQAPLDWMESILSMPPETTGEVGPFGLADADATCAMLTAAGFASVTVEPLDRTLIIGEGATEDEALDDAMVLMTSAGAGARLLREVEPEVRRPAMALLRDGLRDRLADGRVTMGGACWLYRGTV